MPSPDKLFRLDPLETKLTDTQKSVAIQGLADTSARDTQLISGLQSFGKALGTAAEYSKQRRIHTDTRLAENAALRNEELPGDLLPIAQTAYHNIIEINESNNKVNELKTYLDGDEYKNLLNNPDIPTDNKIISVDNIFDEYERTGLQTIQNPEVGLKFKLKVSDLRQSSKKDIYKVERDYKTIQVIQGIANIIPEAIDFAEKTGVKLTDTFTNQWINNISKDVGKIFPDMLDAEKKLLAFKVLATNQDIIGDPEVITELMKQEFSKGFTYQSLYLGKGDDADQFRKIYDQYLQDSKAYFDSLDDEEKALGERLDQEIDLAATEAYINSNGDLEKVKDIFRTHYPEFEEFNKQYKAWENYVKTNYKFGEGSKAYTDIIKRLIVNPRTTNEAINNPVKLDEAIKDLNLDIDLRPKLNRYLEEEGKQRQKAVKSYMDFVGTMNNQLVSLVKTDLKNQSNLLALLEKSEQGPVDPKHLVAALNYTGLQAPELYAQLKEIEILRNNLTLIAENNGFNDAAEGEGIPTRENLQQFRDYMYERIQVISDKINSLRFTTDDAKLETKLKEPSPTATIPEQNYETNLNFNRGALAGKLNFDDIIKQQKEITQANKGQSQSLSERIKQVVEGIKNSLEEELTDFSKSIERFKSGTQIAKDKISLKMPMSSEDQEFYNNLTKPKKEPAQKFNAKNDYDSIMTNALRKNLLLDNPEGKDRYERGMKSTPQEKIINDKTNAFTNFLGTVYDFFVPDVEGATLKKEKEIEVKPEFVKGIIEDKPVEITLTKTYQKPKKEVVTKPESARNRSLIIKEAKLGSNIYNAAPTTKERNEWATNYTKSVVRFKENKLNKDEQRNADRMISILNKAKNSFKDDLRVLGISHENFIQRMIGVYGAETLFGRNKTFLKTGKSETGVRGDLQTTFKTFTDVIKPKGNFGPMMAEAAGYDIKELRKMSDKELKKILYKPDFNYLAGAAIMLSKLQYKK